MARTIWAMRKGRMPLNITIMSSPGYSAFNMNTLMPMGGRDLGHFHGKDHDYAEPDDVKPEFQDHLG